MGFMAGFGSAFADSFNQDQAQKAQHKEDQFRLQYQDYISRRDKQDQIDMENKKNVRLAKQLAAQNNQPPEAWQAGYDLLSGGASPEYVAKMFSENQAIIKPNSNTVKPGEGATASDAQADPRDSLTHGAQTAVDAQMATSGMKTPQGDEPSLFGKVMGGVQEALGGHSQARSARDAQRAQEQVAGAAGVPVDQVQKVLGPGGHVPGEPIDGQPDAAITWTPKGSTYQGLRDKANNLNDAIALNQWAQAHGTPEQQQEAKQLVDVYNASRNDAITQQAIATGQGFRIERAAIKTPDGKGYTGDFAYADYSKDQTHPEWKDKDGNVLATEQVSPIGKDQEADMKAVADEASDSMKTLDQQRLDAKNFIRTAHDYIALLKDTKGKYDGKAMDITGNVSQFIDRWRRAGVNIADLVMPKGDIEDASGALAELDSAEKSVRDKLASGKLVDAISVNAAKATLIDIQGTKLAYQMAAQANGSTKGISNKDFENYKSVVSGGGNPATAAKALNMSIQQAIKAVGDTEGSVKKGKGKTSYYANKYRNAPNGFDIGSRFEDDIKADPELAKATQDISTDASTEDNPGQQVDNSQTGVPDWAQKATKPIIGFTGKEILPGAWSRMSPELQEAIRKRNGL